MPKTFAKKLSNNKFVELKGVFSPLCTIFKTNKLQELNEEKISSNARFMLNNTSIDGLGNFINQKITQIKLYIKKK